MLESIRDALRYAESEPEKPKFHFSPRMPLEIWLDIAEYLTPANGVSLITAIHQKEALLTKPAIIRRILNNSQLMPAYDFNGGREPHWGARNLWSTMQAEARFVGRLNRGPIHLPFDASSMKVTLSGSYLTARDWDTDERFVIPLTGDNRPTMSFTSETAVFLRFGARADDLLVCESKWGPIWLYDLSPYTLPRKKIASKGYHQFLSVLAIIGRDAYLASTAEGYLHTYEVNKNGTYDITRKVSLGGRQIRLKAASAEGNLVIWEDEERWKTLLVNIDEVGEWRSLYTTGSGGCCDGLQLLANSKAISIGDCISVGLMGINPNVPNDHSKPRWFDGHPDLIYAPDGSTVIVRDEVATRSLNLPKLDKEHVFAEGEDLPGWLHTYDSWRKESILPVYRCRDDKGFIELYNEPVNEGI